MSETECLPCLREWDADGWWCLNDHTGCLYNDGHNTCTHEGKRTKPLEGRRKVLTVKLLHFQAQQNQRPSEYLALIDEGESVEEYIEPGYTLAGTYELEPLPVSEHVRTLSRVHELPTGRQFKEW